MVERRVIIAKIVFGQKPPNRTPKQTRFEALQIKSAHRISAVPPRERPNIVFRRENYVSFGLICDTPIEILSAAELELVKHASSVSTRLHQIRGTSRITIEFMSDLFHLFSSKTILCVCVGLISLCFVETRRAVRDVSIYVV